ncbi:MAG: NAD(P)(+) transhydrogenase (Re/Si-specific) subunit beta [Bacteroidetes bacterium]|nr:NAD(P)(+) transhydrogenase (Re/Si-specific) subunit beta [Bacteroidota bacterium]
MQQYILDIIYIVGAFSFIFGIKLLGKPESAKKGNFIAAVGMALAVFGTIFLYKGENEMHLKNPEWIFGGLIIGSVIGTMMAKRVQMTQMPQMVSFFNGMGGACAALISLVEYHHVMAVDSIDVMPVMETGKAIVIYLGLIIGSISFAGSMLAYLKLDEKIKDKVLPFQQVFNIGLMVVILGIAACSIFGWVAIPNSLYILLAISLLYGVLFVMPIGGADMPVVISLLNSFTGVAAAFGGFLYDNKVMLFGGILVGSAGTLLTVLMCKAMNRSLVNVLIGNFGGGAKKGEARAITGTIKEITKTDAASLMKYSKKVVIVPGYGLAVAQAQHICHELEQQLEANDVEVKYAIHPVAGRMPGHMNVLLAESNVAYEKLMEMDEINPEFKSTDVVLVVGANDVVNPAAKNDPASPIYGMPILNVEEATTIIVMKRSMKAGYAGIENELFYNNKTRMLFGDAKKSLTELVAELKNV